MRFIGACGFGRLAEQYVQRQIHGLVGKQIVAHLQMPVVGSRSDHGKRAALAFANGAESIQIFFQNRQYITFLRLVAPDLQRRQAVFFQRHGAQFEDGASPRIVDQFGEGVGQAARAHVVNGDNRVGRAELPAAVDHFLRAPFDFGVAALHGVEIERSIVRARVHRRSRAAAQTDEHARPAELHQQRACGDFAFMCLFCLDIAQTTGNHNRLVIAAHLAIELGFEGAEIAQQVRAAEFVVERRTADGGFNHDVERGGNVGGPAVAAFPRLFQIGDIEVGNRIAGQSRLGARAPPRCAFVADFAARARGRAGKRRNRRGVVVRFHLHQDMGVFFVETVALIGRRIGIKPGDFRAFDYRGVVLIRHHCAGRRGFVRVANHAEQRFGLLFAV